MKPYSVKVEESGPLWDKLMQVNATLQKEAGVSGINPAELLSEAVRYPSVQEALINALDELAGDATGTAATILERTADAAEAAAMEQVQQVRRKAQQLRGQATT